MKRIKKVNVFAILVKKFGFEKAVELFCAQTAHEFAFDSEFA